MWKEKEFAYGVETESKKEVLCENAEIPECKKGWKEKQDLRFLEQSKKSESKIKEKRISAIRSGWAGIFYLKKTEIRN